MSVEARSGEHQLAISRIEKSRFRVGDAEAHVEPLGSNGAVLVVVDGRPTVATVEREGRTARVTVGGHSVEVETLSETDLLLERFGMDVADTSAEREVRAPMPGLVLRVLAAPGDVVEAGQGLVVLEAMKMENELRAPASGTVERVHAEPGAAVAKGDLLVTLT